MAREDRENTSFITDQGICYYNVMPFGLKNVGATFQRLVNKVFSKQTGVNVEAYLDDIVVKRKRSNQHIKDINKVFRVLRTHNINLNPEKYVFKVFVREFLGFIMS